MKNNTEEAKRYLLSAIAAMPNDFSLSEAKNYLQIALSQIEHVEKKRNKRDSQQFAGYAHETKQNYTRQPSSPVLPNWPLLNGQLANPLAALSQIDNLIKIEEQKLQQLENEAKNRNYTPPSRRKNSEDMETILD